MGAVNAGRDQVVAEERGPDVHVQGLGSGVVTVAADDDPYLLDAGAAEEFGGLGAVKGERRLIKATMDVWLR